MSTYLTDELRKAGPQSATSLAQRLPQFPAAAVEEALEALAAQGVLAREAGPAGEILYTLCAPERYTQIHLDVVRDPARGANRRR
jgi:hypothetical protein